jgi:hypothetical protein
LRLGIFLRFKAKKSWHDLRVPDRAGEGVIKEEAHTRMKTMKSHFETPFHALGRALLAAIAVLALSTAQMTASDKEAVPASILNKLDDQLVLVVKKSRGDTTVQPDVFNFGGRVLVEIQGSISTALADQITSLGGQLVNGWGTATTFRAWIPFAQVETLAGRTDITSVAAARVSVTHRLNPR